MESRSYLHKAEEFTNNQIKECPYCNAILPLSEFNDHMFGHQVDQEENGQQSLNINNYGIQSHNNANSLNNNRINMNNNPSNNNNLNNNNNFSNIENNFSQLGYSNNNNEQNQPYINPELQNLNNINIISDNNNNNQNNNNNSNNNNQNISHKDEPSWMNRIKNIKNYFFPSQNNGDNTQNNQNKDDIMNVPIDSLSPEDRERRYKIEEQKAYEKKILGIVHEESKVKVEDNSSRGEKISNFIENNSNTIFAVIDVIGCLTLHTPSIGRTIVRVANFFGDQISNYQNNNQNNNNIRNEIEEMNDYNSLIRSHPELKRKDKDIDTIIKFLPVSEVKEISKNNNENNINKKCIICLSEFEIGDQVSALPCAHVFHTECIASWLKKHCQCPVCKFEITLRSLIG